MKGAGELPASGVPGRKRSVAVLLAFIAVLALLCLALSGPVMKLFSDPEGFRAWVEGHGIWGKVAFVALMLLQVIAAFIPGEPLEIAAGYAFGTWMGSFLCLLGTTLGSLLIFLFVRRWGRALVEKIFPKEKIDSLKFLQDEKKLELLVFILFFIPGTPKDMLTWCVGLTRMKLGSWMAISTTARLPSILTSTVGGDALGMQNYQFAILVFGCTLIISALGLLVYREVCRRKGAGK